MHRVVRIAFGGLAVAALSSACSQPAPAPIPAPPPHPAAPVMNQVDRGKYLVTSIGCDDCHTPFKMGANGPEPDMSRRLSGHPEDMKLPPPPKPQGPWLSAFAATNTA